MWIQRLQQLENDIPVGIIGAGCMGRGLVHQCSITEGIRCLAVADVVISRAINSVEATGQPYALVQTEAEMMDAIKAGKTAVTDDGSLISGCSALDVMIEASSSILEGAKFSETALISGKHLVLMNSEIDLTFGPYLLDLAQKNGVVYTSCDGDQHGVIKRVCDEMALWGFELIMAGNIKGFLDRYSNPTKIIPEADKRNLDYKMATAYTDGSKLCIEMALVSNALGLAPSVNGMKGPMAKSVSDVFHLFDFDELRSLDRPVVDYILGAEPGGGIFCVGYCDDAYQQSMLRYYKMGEGPYYLFYRPYHLCHVEAMQCVAEAYLDDTSLLQPDHGMKTNTIAYAKKDLKAGERLDGLGGYASYGQIETMTPATIHSAVPICLTEGLTLARDIDMDEKITFSDLVDYSNNEAISMYEKAIRGSVRVSANLC